MVEEYTTGQTVATIRKTTSASQTGITTTGAKTAQTVDGDVYISVHVLRTVGAGEATLTLEATLDGTNFFTIEFDDETTAVVTDSGEAVIKIANSSFQQVRPNFSAVGASTWSVLYQSV